MYFNENEYILKSGRKATTAGIIGFFIGIVMAFYFAFSTPAVILFSLLSAYLFLSGYWGVYKLDMWFKKYRHKMPVYIWYLLRIFVLIMGAFLGIIFLGFFEHFILLLAMGSNPDGPGMIGAQIILIPYIGELYARMIKYSPGG